MLIARMRVKTACPFWPEMGARNLFWSTQLTGFNGTIGDWLGPTSQTDGAFNVGVAITTMGASVILSVYKQKRLTDESASPFWF
jgi:hypothetical protein